MGRGVELIKSSMVVKLLTCFSVPIGYERPVVSWYHFCTKQLFLVGVSGYFWWSVAEHGNNVVRVFRFLRWTRCSTLFNNTHGIIPNPLCLRSTRRSSSWVVSATENRSDSIPWGMLVIIIMIAWRVRIRFVSPLIQSLLTRRFKINRGYFFWK